MAGQPKDATGHTRAANAQREFGFDEADFERASRGLIARHHWGRVDAVVAREAALLA